MALVATGSSHADYPSPYLSFTMGIRGLGRAQVARSVGSRRDQRGGDVDGIEESCDAPAAHLITIEGDKLLPASAMSAPRGTTGPKWGVTIRGFMMAEALSSRVELANGNSLGRALGCGDLGPVPLSRHAVGSR